MASEENISEQSGYNEEEDQGTSVDPEMPAEPQSDPDSKSMERAEEAKLKAKYPNLKMSGGSSLLHKRMQRGQKYFDSGDYNMAKAKGGPNPKGKTQIMIEEPIGEGMPTPEDIPRKPSIVQSKLASGALS